MTPHKTRAVITSFHNYCPMYDHKYFNVISDYFLKNFHEFWKDEVDMLYVLDSNWDLFPGVREDYWSSKVTVIQSDPNLRYYNAYKWVLPQIKEDLVFFLDNDMVVYRENVIKSVFGLIDPTQKKTSMIVGQYEVASIYDTCGTYATAKLNGKNKFCPYLFATSKKLLTKYTEVEWGPGMPEHETLGKLTEKMLDDGIRPYEIEEDKNSIYLVDDTIIRDGKPKKLGYYHVRAGSTAAYLLTMKHSPQNQQYWDYLENQPKQEYLRHLAWFAWMAKLTNQDQQILNDALAVVVDAKVSSKKFNEYCQEFYKYHGIK